MKKKASVVSEEMFLLFETLYRFEVKYLIIGGIYADLMTDVPGLDEAFDYYYNMATIDQIEDYEIRYLHYNHLPENKLATGRAKDILDVQELKRINKELRKE